MVRSAMIVGLEGKHAWELFGRTIASSFSPIDETEYLLRFYFQCRQVPKVFDGHETAFPFSLWRVL